VLLVHLLKWKFQPAKRSGSWKTTIADQRDELQDLLEQSPSLRVTLGDAIPQAYRRAVRNASLQTGLSPGAFPSECPFSTPQILDDDFLPE